MDDKGNLSGECTQDDASPMPDGRASDADRRHEGSADNPRRGQPVERQ